MSRCFPFPPPWFETHDPALFRIFKLREEIERIERRRKEKKERMLAKMRELKAKRKERKYIDGVTIITSDDYKSVDLGKRKSNEVEFVDNLVLDMSKRCKI